MASYAVNQASVLHLLVDKSVKATVQTANIVEDEASSSEKQTTETAETVETATPTGTGLPSATQNQQEETTPPPPAPVASDEAQQAKACLYVCVYMQWNWKLIVARATDSVRGTRALSVSRV